MIPFVEQLAPRYWNCLWLASEHSGATNLSSIEVVSASRGFVVNNLKVRRDGLRGIAGLLESQELRMVKISVRSASQYRLRQQRFPPERDETAGIEISGMERPQSHLFN
jgi:hypothetical protein